MIKFLKVFAAIMLFVPAFAFAEIKNADVAKVDELMKTGKYTVVDVRTGEEFAAGHVKGAVNIDYYGDFEEEVVKQLKDKSKPYILYCRSGVRSLNSAQILEEMGYTDITNMTGGILAWEKSGKPIVK